MKTVNKNVEHLQSGDTLVIRTPGRVSTLKVRKVEDNDDIFNRKNKPFINVFWGKKEYTPFDPSDIVEVLNG